MTPTDLPEPVVPATSRCGMRARSATIGSPPMALPSASGSVGVARCGRPPTRASRAADRLAPRVRQLDADDVAAGHDGDARRSGAHRAGDVVGEPDDARGLGAARRLQLEQRDDGAGLDVLDLALDAEVGEHVLEQARVAAQRGLRELGPRPCRAAAASGALRLGPPVGRRARRATRSSKRRGACGASARRRRALADGGAKRSAIARLSAPCWHRGDVVSRAKRRHRPASSPVGRSVAGCRPRLESASSGSVGPARGRWCWPAAARVHRRRSSCRRPARAGAGSTGVGSARMAAHRSSRRASAASDARRATRRPSPRRTAGPAGVRCDWRVADQRAGSSMS